MGTAGGGVVHLPWSEGKLGAVDTQAFEVGDGVVQEEDTSKAGGGGVAAPPSLSGLGARRGGGW